MFIYFITVFILWKQIHVKMWREIGEGGGGASTSVTMSKFKANLRQLPHLPLPSRMRACQSRKRMTNFLPALYFIHHVSWLLSCVNSLDPTLLPRMTFTQDGKRSLVKLFQRHSSRKSTMKWNWALFLWKSTSTAWPLSLFNLLILNHFFVVARYPALWLLTEC